MSSRLTPCIHPVSNAEKSTVNAVFLPTVTSRIAADNVPAAKIIPEHFTGLSGEMR